jgi:hypothetical protein
MGDLSDNFWGEMEIGKIGTWRRTVLLVHSPLAKHKSSPPVRLLSSVAAKAADVAKMMHLYLVSSCT